MKVNIQVSDDQYSPCCSCAPLRELFDAVVSIRTHLYHQAIRTSYEQGKPLSDDQREKLCGQLGIPWQEVRDLEYIGPGSVEYERRKRN